MDNTFNEIKQKLQSKNNWDIVEKTHQSIVASNKNIKFRIFPIYIQYSLGDDLVAVLYFKSKFVNLDEIDLGLNLKSKPTLTSAKDAKYMKYANINFSFTLKNTTDFDLFLKKLPELILN